MSKQINKGKICSEELCEKPAHYKELVANNKCYYCPNKLPEAGGGLDRLDHRLGYQLGNVVPCCRCCNTRKGQLETAGLCYPRTVEVLMEILESERKTNG